MSAGVDSGRAIRLVAEIPMWRPKSKEYGQNARLQHFGRARYTAIAHKKIGDALMVAGWPRELPPGRFRLTFTVYQSRGKLPDDDNLAGCLKSCRDAVADWLATHDGPAGPIAWRYRSRIGPDRVVMVLEEVT